MPSSTTLSTEARGLTKASKAAEESGNLEQARALYLKPAGKFNKASALRSDKIKKSGLAENFYGRSLLFVGKAEMGGRMYKVAVVPKNIRKGLRSY